MNESKQLKALVAEFVEKYREAAAKSHEEYIKNLKPGEDAHIPAEEYIIGDAPRREFFSYCMDLQKKVDEILSGLAEKERDERTAPPSEEAVRIINLLYLRSDVTEDELNDLMNRYGDTYQARKAMLDIAHRNEIYSLDDKFFDNGSAMEDLSRVLRGWFTLDATDRKQVTDGYRAAIEKQIDVAFGDAEPFI